MGIHNSLWDLAFCRQVRAGAPEARKTCGKEGRKVAFLTCLLQVRRGANAGSRLLGLVLEGFLKGFGSKP